MRLKLIAAITLLTSSGLIMALGVGVNQLLIQSVQQHPSVIEKLNSINIGDIQIEQLIAEDGVQISFQTKSKIPLTVKNAPLRADSLNFYLDGMVNARKTLYDFGAFESRISTQQHKQKALELEYIDTFEKTTSRLIKLSLEASKLEGLLAIMSKEITFTKDLITDLKLRFSSGVGTITEIRQAQLSLLDLEVERQSALYSREKILKTLDGEFSISGEQLHSLDRNIQQVMFGYNQNNKGLESILSDQKPDLDRSITRINFEKKSLRSKIEALKSENLPKVTSSLTSVIYGINKYEVYGDVNVEFPLYDSGVSKSKKRGLLYKIKMNNDNIDAIRNEKRITHSELLKKYQDLLIEYQSAGDKRLNLEEKLKHVKLKLKLSSDSLPSKLQILLQLSQIDRIIKTQKHNVQLLTVDYLTMNEQLLVKMLIHPTDK